MIKCLRNDKIPRSEAVRLVTQMLSEEREVAPISKRAKEKDGKITITGGSVGGAAGGGAGKINKGSVYKLALEMIPWEKG